LKEGRGGNIGAPVDNIQRLHNAHARVLVSGFLQAQSLGVEISAHKLQPPGKLHMEAKDDVF